MLGKRTERDAPYEDEDPLAKILATLEDTLATRQSLANDSQSLRECLQLTENLHGALARLHENTSQNILTAQNEQVALQELQQSCRLELAQQNAR